MPQYDTIEMHHVRLWVGLAPGEFSLADASKFFLRKEFDNQASAMSLIMCLEGLVDSGELERVGNRRGYYRQPQSKLVKMDIAAAVPKPEPIFLPFGMSKFVSLFPGNIVTIGGMKNSGKTGLLLNIAFDNRDSYKVHYFNSEMGPEETKLRCLKYCDSNRTGFSEWRNIEFYERSQDFSDVIFTGKGNLNIIDFYECHGEFFSMGEGIRKIHDRLDGAIAIIAIQQNPGNELPLGGSRVTEKSRLHLSNTYNYGDTYPHKLKIEIGKNWAMEGENPRGLYVKYKLGGGCFLKADCTFNPPHIWQREKV